MSDKKLTPEQLEKKRDAEKQMFSIMIQIYCNGNKHTKAPGASKKELCEECKLIEQYAHTRTQHCPRMETKTFCSACTIHCYAPDKLTEVKKIMRYSGPRMMLYHPVAAIKHVAVTLKNKRKAKKESK